MLRNRGHRQLSYEVFAVGNEDRPGRDIPIVGKAKGDAGTPVAGSSGEAPARTRTASAAAGGFLSKLSTPAKIALFGGGGLLLAGAILLGKKRKPSSVG